MIADSELDTIKGWFFISDREVFGWLLERQRELGITGDLVELGCYLGKSAVVIGEYVGPGETFTVLDLFEGAAEDQANAVEMSASYSALTRATFEANYLRFHKSLPVVVQGLSSTITEHVPAGCVRFMHVDASHLYEHVRADIAASKKLLAAGGVVVFDDYRSEHTPGVSCAVWEAVVADGLRPLWVTPSKLYAAWSPAPQLQDDLGAWVEEQDGRAWYEFQEVAGARLMRMKVLRARPSAQPAPAAPPEPKPATDVTPQPAPGPVASPESTRSAAKRLLKELTPPILARGVRSLRRWVRSRRR